MMNLKTFLTTTLFLTLSLAASAQSPTDSLPQRKVYSAAACKENCFFVVSKIHPEHLNVYEVRDTDTVLLASYPVCIAKNRGQKERSGDNRTPESYPGKPFRISQIQDSSEWMHDFGDGRGAIPAYGNWFLRLETPGFRGIGIHGSTNNRESIAVGRGSEGCIRLLDEDIIHLKENYALVGTQVIILPEGHQGLPFENNTIPAPTE
ncbi:MAG: L,D-transpeptidase [Candidatus Cryptobacteroides sp.]